MNCLDRLFRKAKKKIKPFKPSFVPAFYYVDKQESDKAIMRIDIDRINRGLSVIPREEACQKLAEERVFRFIKNGKASHHYLSEDAKELRSHGLSVAELTAYEYSSPLSVVKAWKDSESHSRVLFQDWKYMGLFYKRDGDVEYCCLILAR